VLLLNLTILCIVFAFTDLKHNYSSMDVGNNSTDLSFRYLGDLKHNSPKALQRSHSNLLVFIMKYLFQVSKYH
jgi:hypothetical protein